MVSRVCPICHKYIPWTDTERTDTERTVGWLQTKRPWSVKQYFHLKCLKSIERGKENA